MNTTERFIRDAIEGGFRWLNENKRDTFYRLTPEKVHDGEISIIMLSPTAWQAVGNTRRWEDDGPLLQEWRDLMHGLIDTLCDGKTIEEYLATIEK